MINTKHPYYKDRLTKWLLTLTLLFSVFTFLCNIGNLQTRQQESKQIEIVASINSKIYNRAISYKKGLKLVSFISPINALYKSWKNSLITSNLLTKVKLDNISKQYQSHKFAYRFLQVKKISQSSDEDIFATLIG